MQTSFNILDLPETFSYFTEPLQISGIANIIKPNSIFRYEVLQCGDVEKLVKKRKSADETLVYYVIIEDTFDVICNQKNPRCYWPWWQGQDDKDVKHKLCKHHCKIT